MPPTDDVSVLESNPTWYKDAIIYQVHVRAFYDSNRDGIGDFRGLVQKLDYIRDLGVTAIWLLPFYPSPLRDDGYDIADYTGVHPAYGTVADARRLVREAHRRGIRVIIELVCNHTSDQHPWFQRARLAKPGSAWRNFYVWSDTPDKYRDARVIFKDFESSNWTWDPVAQAYYWHRFYHHQPDLNFDSPHVRRAIFAAVDFWLGMGVDGLRLDAVPYLYEREGTNCENLPETHAFLREIRRHVDSKFKDRMLLAEANQWPEDAVKYFGETGDESHMAFHFPLMPRMFMAIRQEDRFPIIDILNQTPEIPETAQWALFLRNHDELTLEMVTDEERDYMYRVYANDPQMRINLGIRRRLAPLVGNNRRRIELLNGLLFSLPGTPVIYYGDEIGMGDNIYLGDRNSVRTPMQWSADRNAGFSSASRQQLFLPVIVDAEYHYEAVNVETQQNSPYSLLWWMKRLIALRNRYQAFGRGSLEILHPDNRKVLAFIRRYGDEQILVVANVSRFVQAAEIDLSAFNGMVPVELFGRTEFPPIGELPYFITLGPHSFYWFALESQRIDAEVSALARIPTLVTPGRWEELLHGIGKGSLEESLPAFLRQRRWFGGKSRRIKGTAIEDTVPLLYGRRTTHLCLVRVDFTEGDPQSYAIPVGYVEPEWAETLLRDQPQRVIARLQAPDRSDAGVLYDTMTDPEFATALLDLIASRRRVRGKVGEIAATPQPALRRVLRDHAGELTPSVISGEQSNTSVIFGNQLIFKLYRRVEPGINPDLEIGKFLTARRFPHTPPVMGSIEYRRNGDESTTLAILQGFVPNEGDAWSYALDHLGRFYEHAAAHRAVPDSRPISAGTLIEFADQDAPPEARELIDTFLEDARLLGQRTAELHLVLASDSSSPSFQPEPFSLHYQRSLYQSMRTLAGNVLPSLRASLSRIPEAERADAQAALEREPVVMARYRGLLQRKIEAIRTRCHGDYHLGQVLYTGRDFQIIDFEGEPARPVSERRIKRSPLVDVAGMLRSFHYAAYSGLVSARESGIFQSDGASSLEHWARWWTEWVSAYFLKGYFSTARDSAVLPARTEDIVTLLDAFLLDKAIYELGYELNSRPGWVGIPLRGILELTGY